MVKTQRLVVDSAHLNTVEARHSISRAAEILRSGGLVAFPTETVYGLGANALDPAAVARIFAAKQRPSWDPVIVHIAGPATHNPMLDSLVTEISEPARKLMAAFWPGPLTLLLPRSAAVPDTVTAARALVGIRMPAHPVAFEVINKAGIPVAAPSANLFGHISPTRATHVLEDLDGRIDAILDAGPTRHGVESTVLDPCQSPMVIYRPGAITAAQIQQIAGPVEIFQPSGKPEVSGEALASPGVGLRHYAPRARLILIDSTLADMAQRLAEMAAGWADERLGLMLPTELTRVAPLADLQATVFSWGRWADMEDLGRNLYAGLRTLDAAGCNIILCPLPPAEGVGVAIRDRLRKAAHPANSEL